MKVVTEVVFLIQIIVKNSQSTCKFVDSETYGRLEVKEKDRLVPTKCAKNLVFESKDGKKYCLRNDFSNNDDKLTLNYI